MIYINNCSSFSSPVDVTFGYEIEFCKVIFFKYSFSLVLFITIDTDDRLKNHISLFPTLFLACISNRLTSWATAVIGTLRCPFGFWGPSTVEMVFCLEYKHFPEH